MVRYQLILAYDGSGFVGSQRQGAKRTAQGELEKALRKLGWKGKSVILAGRTDTGVHASGQVASCDFEWKRSAAELQKALNATLPLDMAVSDAREAPMDFHPRFDAVSRRYVYKLFCQPVRDPLRERFAWRVWTEVNDEALHRAAALLIGTHDFSAFGSATSPKGSTTRTVISSRWIMRGDEKQFEVRADAFLYRMVRRMVFVQVAAARSKCSLDEIRDALEKQSKLPAGIAPAHGLTLAEVTYGSME